MADVVRVCDTCNGYGWFMSPCEECGNSGNGCDLCHKECGDCKYRCSECGDVFSTVKGCQKHMIDKDH